ncbi:MAG: LemA family protein [Clostridiales bacterium]|jgi:hypothetical protein|nr:LemA family protein [Clostridiales bacterium]
MNFIFLFLLCFAYIWFVLDKLICCEKEVNKSWKKIFVQIQRRLDFAEDIVNIFINFKDKFKNKIVFDDFNNIKRSFNNLVNDRNQIMKINKQLCYILTTIFRESENIYELKNNIRLKELKYNIVRTEDKIIYEQQFFNANIKRFNETRNFFPNNLYINLFKSFKLKKFFNADEFERSLPKSEEN